jgi:hypothetical protein
MRGIKVLCVVNNIANVGCVILLVEFHWQYHVTRRDSS